MSESTRSVHAPIGAELLLALWLAFAEEGVDDAEVMRRFNVSKNTAASVRYSRDRYPVRRADLEQRLRDGSIFTLNQLMAEAGFAMPNRGKRGKSGAVGAIKLSKDGREVGTIAYGKGDPWREVSEPMRRYLRGWSSRDFLFRHINPREANYRVILIDELIDGLQKAREDLVARSHKSSYSVPSNRKRKEK